MEPQLVTDSADLDSLVDRLLAADRYALDTEFHRERTYWPSLALVQVAWPAGDAGPAGVALVDPLAVDVAPLAAVLEGGAGDGRPRRRAGPRGPGAGVRAGPGPAVRHPGRPPGSSGTGRRA